GAAAVGCELAQRGGRPGPLPAGRDPVLRPAARRALGRYFAPRPQLELGRWLATRPRGGATDQSDGLAKDLHHLCAASGIGATVETERLPIPPSLRRLAEALGLDPVERALGGGEDYVLLFTLPAGQSPPQQLACRRIGRLEPGPDILLEAADGTHRLPSRGWDHLTFAG
ncbi:MAG: thiamine-phosphate kinase, partial [Thermoanaerobaculia bacterium]|nr:thiamine-phosphate kinase [Thermoanaerobaculia bacterium]